MMLLRSSVRPLACERTGRISAMILLRLVLALAISFVLIATTLAADRPTLKGDIVVNSDALTLGDLVDGIPAAAATRPLFRAPALGESGTIQVRRILDAARDLALPVIETGARTQIVVTRAARRVGFAEIETAVKRVLASQYGLTAGALSINFDGPPPSFLVGPDFQGQLAAEDVVYDRRTRRVSALVSAGVSPTERKASARISGTVLEYAEVAVLTRPLNKGETAQASDLALEKRARETLPSDAQLEAQGLAGRVARRALQAGSIVRVGDLARPEMVSRGDVVTIVYEVPGMMLTLRGRASDSGAQGDTISVVNPQSKKTLQAQVVAPGRVSVSAPMPGRVAANTGTAQP